MAIVIEGPSGGSSTGYFPDDDYNAWINTVLQDIMATEDSSSLGPSVQQSGNFGRAASLQDEVAGKVGPCIGKWDPELGNRMIQEF